MPHCTRGWIACSITAITRLRTANVFACNRVRWLRLTTPTSRRRRTGERASLLLDLSELHDQLLRRVMDTNLVRPFSVDRTEVIFDFYFADVSDSARERNLASVEAGERIQQEDLDICASVQRGLQSRAYNAGRLSVRREAGEHLFHRLLHADLKSGISLIRLHKAPPGNFLRDLLIALRKDFLRSRIPVSPHRCRATHRRFGHR